MANVYQSGLIQVKPQYAGFEADTPENILWFQGSFITPLTLAQLTNIQAAFDTPWGNMWKSGGSSQVNYMSCIVTDWSSNTGAQILPNGSVVVPGTGSQPCGSNVALLISKNIGLRWRGGHPRTYMPGMSSAYLANPRQWLGTFLNTYATDYAAMLTAMSGLSSANGGPFTEKVYRFRNNAAKAALYSISTYVMQPVPASQRRRLRRVTRK